MDVTSAHAQAHAPDTMQSASIAHDTDATTQDASMQALAVAPASAHGVEDKQPLAVPLRISALALTLQVRAISRLSLRHP